MNQNNELSNKQKILAFSLILLGFFVLFFWYMDLKNGLKSSLIHNANNKVVEKDSIQSCQSGQCFVDGVKIDKVQDTDKDGISDYDELNIYGTFPYISDSDSDGISDGDEIKNGTDPMCPEGEKCEVDSVIENEEGVVGVSNDNFSDFKDFDFDSVKISSEMASSSEMERIMSGKGSVDEIRAMLISAGVGEEIINSMSDEILIQGYKSTLSGENNEFIQE